MRDGNIFVTRQQQNQAWPTHQKNWCLWYDWQLSW